MRDDRNVPGSRFSASLPSTCFLSQTLPETLLLQARGFLRRPDAFLLGVVCGDLGFAVNAPPARRAAWKPRPARRGRHGPHGAGRRQRSRHLKEALTTLPLMGCGGRQLPTSGTGGSFSALDSRLRSLAICRSGGQGSGDSAASGHGPRVRSRVGARWPVKTSEPPTLSRGPAPSTCSPELLQRRGPALVQGRVASSRAGPPRPRIKPFPAEFRNI